MLKHLSYANVMATVAVFIALGGVTYAATNLPPDSVGTRELKSESVGAAELKLGAVNHGRLKDHSVGENNMRQNAVGPRSLQGNAVDSDQLHPDAVTSDKVKDFSLGFDDLAPGAVSPRLFAHISSSGVLGDNSGVVNAGRVSKGQYQVTFNRDLHGCVAVSGVGFGFGPGVIGAGATAQARMNLDNNPNTVGITAYRGFTFNDVQDNDVNVIVAC